MNTPHDLKSAGLKATLPRIKIINLFETTKQRHMTAEDVYKQLLAEGLDIGLATVYRVLTQFEQAGLLVRHHFESGKSVFELNEGKHHDHLVCMDCGRVEEFFDAEIEKRQKAVAQTRGFELQEHSLALYAAWKGMGMCPATLEMLMMVPAPCWRITGMTACMAIAAPLYMQKMIYFFKFFFRCLFIFGINTSIPSGPYGRRIHINDIFTKITAANGCFS